MVTSYIINFYLECLLWFSTATNQIRKYEECKSYCIPESFNTIFHTIFLLITFVNSQHEKSNSKGEFVLKKRFETFVYRFLVYKKNLTQIQLRLFRQTKYESNTYIKVMQMCTKKDSPVYTSKRIVNDIKTNITTLLTNLIYYSFIYLPYIFILRT